MRRGRQPLMYSTVLSNLLLLLLACACDTTIKTDEAEVGDALSLAPTVAPCDTFRIDTATSEITWIGSKMTGRHNGIFLLQGGELLLHNGKLNGGTIIIDMASLQTTDKGLGEESSRKLNTHMKSADFFDVEVYPLAIFELVKVMPYDSTAKLDHTQSRGRSNFSELKVKNPTHLLTGNLNIKETVRSITFPVRISLAKNELKAKANFNIDRTKWNLIYRSDESLGDKTIYANVNIGFEITARPATTAAPPVP